MGFLTRGNEDFAAKRERLVRALAERRHELDPRVIEAIARVPRHAFVPQDLKEHAYDDQALPIGSGQTVSAPHMVAIMGTVLQPQSGDRVLEVGTGSGYHAAVLAELVGPKGTVVSVEFVPELAEKARVTLERAGYRDRVEVHTGDGAQGVPEAAPFDRISIAAASPRVPPALLDQLAVGGALVAPLGKREAVLTRYIRTKEAFQESEHGLCVFVPLTGPHASL